MQSPAPQLIWKGNALAQYLLQAKSHWICQWTHSFAAQSYTFTEVKWSLIRAKLPSVGTSFSWNSLVFLTPELNLVICLRYQMSRNLDKPKILLEGKLLSVGNEPTMRELQLNLCTIEETRTHWVPPTITQLCIFVWDVLSLFPWLTEIWHCQLKISKVACADQGEDVQLDRDWENIFPSTGTALENNPTFTMQKWSLKCFFSLFEIIIPTFRRKKSGQISMVIVLHMIQHSVSQQPMYLQKCCHPGKSNSVPKGESWMF